MDVVDVAARDLWVPGPEVSSAQVAFAQAKLARAVAKPVPAATTVAARPGELTIGFAAMDGHTGELRRPGSLAVCLAAPDFWRAPLSHRQ